jgi:hypothetical protein
VQKGTRTALLAFAALALPVGAAAQEAQPQPQAPASAAAPAAPQNEVQQIQQRIAALQQQAMQDPSVKTAEATFEAELLAAMTAADPAVTQKAARAEAMKQEVEAARQAGDNARLQALATEAQQLQAYFNPLRQRVLQQPDIQQKRQAFLAVVFEKMTQLDPQAPTLVQRLQELRNGGAQAAPQQPTGGSQQQ